VVAHGGWLMFTARRRPDVLSAPRRGSDHLQTRVGSLTCFKRIAAFWACLSRRSAPVFALIALFRRDRSHCGWFVHRGFSKDQVPGGKGVRFPARLGNI